MRWMGGQPRLVVGESGAMRDIIELVDMVASTDCCILIEGESGTGKELVARRLHEKGPRGQKPFIPVNCAGISETLFESQFFGHVKGAFTGADATMLGLVRAADGGTLFLDEVSEIPLPVQAKLLRVFQEGELIPVGTNAPIRVNTRFIVAANRSLREQVAAGRFRADLFFRMNVVRIHLPPLRERPEDIPHLLDHFLADCAERFHRPLISVDLDVRSSLRQFSWPGNVRELANWVERLYATGLPAKVLAADLGLDGNLAAPNLPPPVMSLDEAERWVIGRAMDAAQNNVEKAAEMLHIHRTTLWRKLRAFKTP
jgi:two-component system, NtrC family, response regulator AtoC